MTIPQDSRAPHRQQRWIALHNVGPDEIPPYGIVEIVEGVRPEQGSALTPDGGPTVVQVRKPQTDCGSAFLINGPLPIPVRGYGQPGTNDYPCYVRYNTADGTPTPNDMWGTVKDSYAIGRGRQGLAIVGDADTVDGVPLVRVMRSERLIRVTPFGDGAVMFPGQPTRCYVMRHNGTFWENTDTTVVVEDPFYRTCALSGEEFWAESYGQINALQRYETVCEFGLRRRARPVSPITPNSLGTVVMMSVTPYPAPSCVGDRLGPLVDACWRTSGTTVLRQTDEIFIHYHPEFRRWFILTPGGGAGLIRFEMLTKLPLGGRGDAIEVESGPTFTRKGEPFKIKDPYKNPGMWRYDPKAGYPDPYQTPNPQKRGYMGWCVLPPDPEYYGDQPIYEVVWMEQIARHIVFKTVEDKNNAFSCKAELAAAGDWYHLQGKDPKETDLWDDSDPATAPGTLVVTDPPGGFMFPHVLKGAYGHARYNDRDHWYEMVNVQQMCLFLDATLLSNVCPGDATAPIDTFAEFSFSPFNQKPETLTTANNPYRLAAKTGEEVLLGWSESKQDWQAVQMQHRARTLLKESELNQSDCVLQLDSVGEICSIMSCEEETAELSYVTFDQVEVVTGFSTHQPSSSDNTCGITAARTRICSLGTGAADSIVVIDFEEHVVVQDVYQDGLCIALTINNFWVPCVGDQSDVNAICGTDCSSS